MECRGWSKSPQVPGLKPPWDKEVRGQEGSHCLILTRVPLGDEYLLSTYSGFGNFIHTISFNPHYDPSMWTLLCPFYE